jgi:hypothetical protein
MGLRSFTPTVIRAPAAVEQPVIIPAISARHTNVFTPSNA